MSTALFSFVVLVDLILPLALLLWALTTRAKSQLYLISILLSAAVVIGVLTPSLFGQWYLVGAFWPPLLIASFAAVLLVRLIRRRPTRWSPQLLSWEALLTVVNIAHLGLWALLIPQLLQARSYQGPAFELSSPLRGGTFYVVGGGANISVNQHPDYAIDIGRLNRFGFGAAGVFPEDLTRYPAFGSEVVAPCAGEVISAENARPNQPPATPDAADRQGGNHVVIFCDGHSVHLAHMQPGSVAVELGDRVEAGQHLGLVGNSGNTALPHLHVNVAAGRYLFERGIDPASSGAAAVPFRIDGRFLVKGDTFTF